MKKVQSIKNIEYNIIDIVRLILLNKKLIFLSTIIFLLFGLLTSFYFISHKKITATINPKSSDYIVKFMDINRFKPNDCRPLEKYGDKLEGKKEVKKGYCVDRVNLLIKFRENLYDKQIFKNTILEHSLNMKNQDIDKENIDRMVLSLINNLKYNTKNKNGYLILNLSLKTSDVQKDIQILNTIISRVSKKVGKLEVKRFEKNKNILLTRQLNEIKILEKKIEILRKGIQLYKNKHLEFLGDQYEIAKKLKMPERSLKYFSKGEYYLRGYLAIHEEIKVYNSKSNETLLKSSPEFIDLKQKLLKAKSNTIVNDFQIAFDKTPFANGDFTTIAYDGDHKVGYIINPLIIIILFTIIGFLLSTLIILINNIYKNLDE
ncbi:hypothetical protein OA529_00820 [Alphaproteobacteria bacterium]|nr:hypothetical protein [Alphaproteobacteria bacterium]